MLDRGAIRLPRAIRYPSFRRTFEETFYGRKRSSAALSRYDTRLERRNFDEQRFIEFVPCPGEKRVRIDVYDPLDNYAVFAGQWLGRTFTVSSEAPLTDWVIALT